MVSPGGEDGLLLSSVVQRAQTRIDARFRFDNVPPGEYTLWAEDTFGSETVRWSAPARVEAGKTLTFDLNPARALGDVWYCFLGRAGWS
jgi:hypothetical protein